jgi:hypothetical protein
MNQNKQESDTAMKPYVLFQLAAHAPKGYPDIRPDLTVYEQIRLGIKTTEYRFSKEGFDGKWMKLLFRRLTDEEKEYINILGKDYIKADLTKFLRVHKARFVAGYPKNSLPRLEADITGALFGGKALGNRIDILISNVKEVKESSPDS